MTVDHPPDFPAARDHVIGRVVRFARTLRAHGAEVPANAALEASAALVEVGLDDRQRVAAAMRATLVKDRHDLTTFDAHFPAFWYGLRTGLEAAATADDFGDRSSRPLALFSREDPSANDGESAERSLQSSTADDDEAREWSVHAARLGETPSDGDAPTEPDGDRRPATASAVGDGEPVSIDAAVGPDTADAAVMARFVDVLASLRGRRWSRSPAGARIDPQRALRSTLSTGGVPVRLPTRERTPRYLRATVLVDVSRSVLDAVDQAVLLAILDALVASARSVRVFFFDTGIREVSDVFARGGSDPWTALEREKVSWGGGTRIGESLATLRQRWPDAVDHRRVTVVISDGLEVGDVDRLEHEMARLRRGSGPILWFNPLAVSSSYEPTCRGMAAALPFVDGLFALGGWDDVDAAATQLARHGPKGPIGYEHDFRDREPAGGVSSA